MRYRPKHHKNYNRYVLIKTLGIKYLNSMPDITTVEEVVNRNNRLVLPHVIIVGRFTISVMLVATIEITLFEKVKVPLRMYVPGVTFM
jgi:hypothetical protein